VMVNPLILMKIRMLSQVSAGEHLPPHWTIASYALRSSAFSNRRSVLAEGSIDRDITARVLIQYYGDNWSSKFQIDTAEFIRSPEGQRLGNRQKIEAVFSQLQEPSNLTGLVDREYRGLDGRPEEEYRALLER